MRVKITKELHFGNPGERRILPVGALAIVVPADNLPKEPGIEKFWARPLISGKAGGWPADTERWAEDVGCLVYRTDFAPVGPETPPDAHLEMEYEDRVSGTDDVLGTIDPSWGD